MLNGLISRLAAGLGLAAAGLFMAVAQAQTTDPFTVQGIAIDATASNATEAQRQALAQGQLNAAGVLLRRITLPEDLAASEMPPLSASQAAELIAGFNIANERRSPTRYIGTLTVNFDRRSVQTYLAGFGIPFVQSQARPILAVPVLQRDTGSSVWAGPWYDAWLASGSANSLTPFIPLGSRTEAGEATEYGLPGEPVPLGRRMLSTADAESLNETTLRALARAYGVDRVAVVLARASGDSVRANGQILDFSGPEMTSEAIASVATGGGYAETVRRLIEQRETEWKRASIVRDTTRSTLQLTVLHTGIRNWRELQLAVAGSSLVLDARLDALSRNGAVMTLSYVGDIEQVRNELAARGARLEDDPVLGWTVRSSR